MEGLVHRLSAIERRSETAGGMDKDLRVIEMQIARAEEKVMRLGRSSSWTRSYELFETMEGM